MAQVPLFGNTVLILPLFFFFFFFVQFPLEYHRSLYYHKISGEKSVTACAARVFFSHKAIIFGAVSL